MRNPATIMFATIHIAVHKEKEALPQVEYIYVYYWHRRRFIWKCPPPFIHAKLGSLARVLLLVISFLPLIGTIHIGHFISRSSYEVRGFQTYSTHTIYGTAHTTLFK